MTSTIYSINPKYIFKFDNEFNEMIKNNHFKDYLMESIIALLTILIDKNEYNLNQTTPDNFNFFICIFNRKRFILYSIKFCIFFNIT